MKNFKPLATKRQRYYAWRRQNRVHPLTAPTSFPYLKDGKAELATTCRDEVRPIRTGTYFSDARAGFAQLALVTALVQSHRGAGANEWLRHRVRNAIRSALELVRKAAKPTLP